MIYKSKLLKLLQKDAKIYRGKPLGKWSEAQKPTKEMINQIARI